MAIINDALEEACVILYGETEHHIHNFMKNLFLYIKIIRIMTRILSLELKYLTSESVGLTMKISHRNKALIYDYKIMNAYFLKY
jgi:hypothetical protein